MKPIVMGIMLFLCAGSAQAQCYKEIKKPQRSKRISLIKWNAAGRTWLAELFWKTVSVSDNGEEEATVVLAVSDRIPHPEFGDGAVYHLTPNRCDKRIEPSLFPVKLMGRDFLLVTFPTSQWGRGGSGIVASRMYSIDEKGYLEQVFRGAYRGTFTRGTTCRHLLRSYIQPVNEDGSRIAWVYEAPGVEWARRKADCNKSKVDRVANTWVWKNGCFTVENPDDHKERLGSSWDEEVCVPGVGLVDKKARPDGGMSPDAGAAPAAEPATPRD